MSATGILSLPNELLMYIRDHLDLEDNLELRTTNYRFYSVCHSTIKTIYVEHCTFPRDLCLAGFNGINFWPEVIIFDRNTKIDLDSTAEEFLTLFGSKCKVLKLRIYVDEVTLSRLLEFFPKLVRLKTDEATDVQNLTEPAKNVVKKLNVFDFNLYGELMTNKFPIDISTMSNLEVICTSDYSICEDENFTKNLLEVVKQQARKLHTLRLQFMPRKFYEQLVQLPKLRLKNLLIETWDDHAVPESAVLAAIKKQPYLEKLEIEETQSWNSNNIIRTIETSCRNLKSLMIFEGQEQLDFSFITNLPHLRRLEINSIKHVTCSTDHCNALGVDMVHHRIRCLALSFNAPLGDSCCHTMLRAFSNVQSLYVENLHLSQRSFEVIFANPNLTSLTLWSCEFVSDNELIADSIMNSSLEKLEIFYSFRRNGNWIKCFPKMPELLRLKLEDKQCSVDFVHGLLRKCGTQLIHLTLPEIYDYDEGQSRLFRFPLTKIRVLYLHWGGEEDFDGVKCIAGWQSLRRLHMPSSFVNEDKAMDTFGKMPNLMLVKAINMKATRSDFEKYKQKDEKS